ncbi:hypothetical protein BGW38_005378 [Lunasporangiospora selenospora]|uniref:alkaline phosphatase n=1 Tax=Lunasporangiospora selenospora TaxID=979761 RepID=A0A9P6G0D1_9FUNG|nr:hypothetical protein BGW38_005378 [Lunasporangiospora selenospora]
MVVDPDQVPCGTILEAAKALGMLTGLVVTSRVTHATPASFSAHVVHRDLEADIATHQIGDYVLGRQVDLMMGGGKCFFMPNTTEGSCRQDDRDLLGEREKYGWSTLMTSLKDMNDLNKDSNYIKLPALGLFNLDHLNYMIDTNLRKDEPTLSQMAEAALKALKRNAGPSQGFFLMIEGSRIDMGAHNNDPVAHLHEILEYHATVAAVRKFVKNNPNTLLISTSDHETGGFTLGYQPDPHKYPDYQWFPEVIDRATASTEILAPKVFGYKGKDRREYVRTEILRDGLGITDPTKEELDYLSDPSVPQGEIMVFLGHAISHRAYLGWTTIGHTGLDVNLYAEGENSSLLRGNHENTEIGQIMSEYLNVDLQAITKKLTK